MTRSEAVASTGARHGNSGVMLAPCRLQNSELAVNHFFFVFVLQHETQKRNKNHPHPYRPPPSPHTHTPTRTQAHLKKKSKFKSRLINQTRCLCETNAPVRYVGVRVEICR